jgi:general stress protein YciG
MARFPAATKVRVPASHSEVRFAHWFAVSCRMETALRRAGFVRLGDLDGRTLGEIARVRGLGRKTLPELIDLLAGMGALGPPRIRTAWEAGDSASPRRPRGFAALDADRLREISRRGGNAVHAPGNGGHHFTPAEARVAGSKGGKVSAQRRAERALRGARTP